jgi:hypothetical protein
MDCKFQDWVLDCHVFAVYNPTDGGDAGRAAFEALVESVRALFRANRTLPAGDSLPTTQLLAIGAGAAVATDPWVDDSGMVLRHTRVGLDVHEVIYE